MLGGARLEKERAELGVHAAVLGRRIVASFLPAAVAQRRRDEAQAQQIFRMHKLPAEGCSVQALTSKLIDSPAEMANVVREQTRRLHGDAARPATAMRPRTPRRMENPYKTSHLCSNAWAQHAQQHAAAAAERIPPAPKEGGTPVDT